MKKLPYKNEIIVAGHRGFASKYPENTLVSFKAALDAGVDMVETDVHITRDGYLVLIHDATVDRTTDGTGFVCHKTLKEIKDLDAGSFMGEEFKGEKIPTLEELLELTKDHKDLLYNIEFKDYYNPNAISWQKSLPREDVISFCCDCTDKIMAVLKEYGVYDRCVMNSWSGIMLEYISEKYPDAKIHSYSPQEYMGLGQKRFHLDYAYCTCLWGPPEKKVVPKRIFDITAASGVEPWIYYHEEDEAAYDEAIGYGAKLITANDPERVIKYLKAKGLHK